MLEQIFVHPAFLFFIGFLGLVCHFLKDEKIPEARVQMNGFLKAFYNYLFRYNVKNTIYAGIGFVIGYIIALQLGDVGVYSMFLTGYSVDSFFNKAEKK